MVTMNKTKMAMILTALFLIAAFSPFVKNADRNSDLSPPGDEIRGSRLTVTALLSNTTAQNQALITSLSDGDTVLFQAGIYTLTGSLTVDYRDLTLIGSGVGVTTISYTGTAFSVSFANVTFQDMNIVSTTGSAIIADSASHISVNNMSMVTGSAAALSVAGDIVEVVDTEISTSGTHCLISSATSARISIVNSAIDANGRGVYFTGASAIANISNTQIISTSSGIYASGSAASVNLAEVEINAGDYGVYMTGTSTFITVVNSSINSVNMGIYFSGSRVFVSSSNISASAASCVRVSKAGVDVFVSDSILHSEDSGAGIIAVAQAEISIDDCSITAIDGHAIQTTWGITYINNTNLTSPSWRGYTFTTGTTRLFFDNVSMNTGDQCIYGTPAGASNDVLHLWNCNLTSGTLPIQLAGTAHSLDVIIENTPIVGSTGHISLGSTPASFYMNNTTTDGTVGTGGIILYASETAIVENSVIDGSITINNDGVNLTNTQINSSSSDCVVVSGPTVIDNCAITHNGTGGYGVYPDTGTGTLDIINTEIIADYGIYVETDTVLSLVDSVVSGDYAIYYDANEAITIDNCNITSTEQTTIQTEGIVSFTDSQITGDVTLYSLTSAAEMTFDNCILPTSDSGVYISSNGGSFIINNTHITSTNSSLQADGIVLEVSNSFLNATAPFSSTIFIGSNTISTYIHDTYVQGEYTITYDAPATTQVIENCILDAYDIAVGPWNAGGSIYINNSHLSGNYSVAGYAYDVDTTLLLNNCTMNSEIATIVLNSTDNIGDVDMFVDLVNSSVGCDYGVVFLGNGTLNSTGTTYNSTIAAIVCAGSLDAYILNSTFDIAVNSTVFLFNNTFYNASTINWTVGNTIIPSNYTFVDTNMDNITILHESITDFNWNSSLVNTGTVTAWIITNVYVGIEENITVDIEDTPYNVVASENTVTGRAAFDYILELSINGTIRQLNYFIYRIELPETWDMDNTTVVCADNETAMDFNVTDTTISWYSRLATFVVSSTLGDGEMVVTQDNESVVDGGEQGTSTNESENQIIITNNDPALEFHYMNITIGHFVKVSGEGMIYMNNFTLYVYQYGVLIGTYVASNGYVNISILVPYGASISWTISFYIPAYTPAGNYTAPWTTLVTNELSFGSSGNIGASITPTPKISLSYVKVVGASLTTQSQMEYQDIIQGGVTTNMVTTNVLKVSNDAGGNIGLTSIRFSQFTDLDDVDDDPDADVPLSGKIKIERGSLAGTVFTWTAVQTTWTTGNTITVTTPVALMTSAYFRFIVTDIPTGHPAGTYLGTFRVNGVHTTALAVDYISPSQQGQQSMDVDLSSVGINVRYTTTATPSQATATQTPSPFDATGVQFGTIVPPIVNPPGETSDSWIYVTSTGQLPTQRLTFVFTDLTNGIYSIPIRNNGLMVDASGVTKEIPVDGIVNYDFGTTGLASGVSVWFKVRIKAIPVDQHPTSYSGTVAITARYQSGGFGSRDIPTSSNYTVLGEMGTDGAFEPANYTFETSNGGDYIIWSAPVEVGDYSVNHLQFTNEGEYGVFGLGFTFHDLKPARFVVRSGTFDYIPEPYGIDEYIFVPFGGLVPQGGKRDIYFYVSHLEGYNEAISYSQNVSIRIGRINGAAFEYLDVGTTAFKLGEDTPGNQVSFGVGRQWLCMPTALYATSADFLAANPGVYAIGYYNQETQRYTYSYQGTFDIEVGQGYILFVVAPVTINLGTVPFFGTYTVSYGRNLRGDPTQTSISLSDILIQSPDLAWAAAMNPQTNKWSYLYRYGTSFIGVDAVLASLEVALIGYSGGTAFEVSIGA